MKFGSRCPFFDAWYHGKWFFLFSLAVGNGREEGSWRLDLKFFHKWEPSKQILVIFLVEDFEIDCEIQTVWATLRRFFLNGVKFGAPFEKWPKISGFAWGFLTSGYFHLLDCGNIAYETNRLVARKENQDFSPAQFR